MLILWLALLARLDQLELTRQNLDRAYPHGLGILIRDALASSHLSELPRLGITASISLPNPAGASYLLALLTALDPDPYTATALNALANVLVVAVAMHFTRRSAGFMASLGAGLLAGVSPWAVWVARGAWLQGGLEAAAALTCWLMMNGLVHERRKHLLAGLTLTALTMQTYLVAFGLLAQVLAMTAIRWRTLRATTRRAALTGLALCAASVIAYVGALNAEGFSLRQALDNPNAHNEVTASGQLNLDPLTHLLRVASGRDFENTFVEADSPGYAARDWLSDLRAGVVEMLAVIGVAALAARRAPADVLLLTWAALPTFGALVIGNVAMPSWKVHVFYLLLASPAPYAFAGTALSAGALLPSRAGRVVFGSALSAVVFVAALISAWNLQGEREALARFPLHHDGLHSLALRWQRALAREARQQCQYLSNDEPQEWLISLMGKSARARRATYRQSAQGAAWLIGAEGGACLIATRLNQPPAHADLVWQSALQGVDRTDRSPARVALFRVRDLPAASADDLKTNLGWSQAFINAPAQALAGQVVTITQGWRITALPDEPFWFWYFAPFVTLRDANGQAVAQLDRLPAFEGWQWRIGDTFYSEAWLRLPDDLPPGIYALEISLFDPNQGKNAVFFSSLAPEQPMITIQKQLLVQAPNSRSASQSLKAPRAGAAQCANRG